MHKPMRKNIALVALAGTLFLQAQPIGWTQATPGAPSQTPLITRDGGQPKPNVMLTLDTSWSMIFPYVPEGAFQVNGFTVKFPGFTSPIMHPDDTRYATDQGPAVGDGGAIPADALDTTNVFQRQMRSPDVNQLYYDPRQVYKPWLITKDLVTGAETRYPPAVASQAWFDPDKNGPADRFANLTDQSAATTAISKNVYGADIYWCNQNPGTAGDKLRCATGAKRFNPAIYYRLVSSTADPTVATSYQVYDINSAMTFTKHPNRTDCGPAACSQAEELQNYANWFVYYRTRLHVVQAAIPESFLQLSDIIRVGWGTIHQGVSDIDGANNAIVQSGVRDLSTARKAALVKWIRNFQSDKSVTDDTAQPKLKGGTPLLTALTGVGEYFRRADGGSPWSGDPTASNGGPVAPLSCRRSYNMLITDGYYNDTSTVGNEDGTDGVAIAQGNNPSQTYTYAAARPFSDAKSGTLADIAMKYWKSDLRPDPRGIANNVPYGNDTPQEDPAFWQHLVQFPIGLGVSGNIPISDLSNQLTLLTNGTKGWWDGGGTITSTDPRRIDDLLHAAVNSRGQYFSAKNAAELTEAMTSALNRTAERPGLKEAGVGAASLLLSANNVKYVPEYTTTSWIGDVKAFALDADGVVAANYTWSAAERRPAAGNRNIVTWNGSSGVSFTWGTIGDTDKALITPTLPTGTGVTPDDLGGYLVNYIRGDTTYEDTTLKTSLFRKRNGKLPDFVNSPPVLIKGNVNLHYENMVSGDAQSSYAAFAHAKAARPPVLFIGGNGGMLHAFADYAAAGVARGQEVFAYVPKAVLPNLSVLAQKSYGKTDNYHRYYVDGPLVETDAYLGTGWKNILVGTLGAGGKGIFALNVTDATSMGPSSILWERSSADDADMGYMFAAPQVGVLANGQWAVFVGNGSHSAEGKAALLVINLSTGTISKVVVDATGGNGLGGVTLVKNANQQVIGAYAGDLKGNVWHFTVTDTGTTAASIFTATTRLGVAQPITAAPGVMPHPNGGYLIVIGTGKLQDTGDNDDTSLQTLYGLWDKPNAASNITRAKLVEQTIGAARTATGGTYYALSSNAVDYGSLTTDVRGWYIDMTIEAGQRLIYTPTIIRNYVLVGTIVPARTADFCSPANEGKGYNFLMPALTGGQSTVPVLDTDRNGRVTDADLLVSVFESAADGGDTILTKDVNGRLRLSIQNTKGQQGAELPGEGTPKQIIGRTWRQILNPPRP